MLKFKTKYFIVIIVFAIIFAFDVSAFGNSSYHYRVKAKAQVGAGKVYARTDSEHGPWLFQNEVASRRYEESSQSVSKTVYLYATPDEGYALDHWESPNGTTVKSGDSQSFSFSDDSKTITKPDIFLYKAYFSETYVSAYTANPELCVVEVSPAVNSPGMSVTLKATTKSSCAFKGWRKKGTSTILSENATLQVDATNEKVTYEAVFGDYTGSQITFSRLQSKSELSKYICLVQDEFSYTRIFTVARGYSNISSTTGKKDALESARVYLKGGTYTNSAGTSVTAAGNFALSGSVFDPGTVIFSSNGRFYAQGTNSYYITDGYACHHAGSTTVGVDYAPLKVNGQTVSFTNGGRFSIAPSMYGISLGTLYVINNDGELDVTQDSKTTDNYNWNQLTIDDSTNYFAFNPTVESGGKYYATLRTAFSWKIKNTNHVKAYEVLEIPGQNQLAIMHQFADDEIVPGGLSVILETDSQDPEVNILKPHDLTYTKSNPVLYDKYGTRLHCYTGLKNSGDQYDNCTEDGIGYFKVKYTKANTVPIYKLSVNDEGEVGFWTKVAQNDTISGNEAYAYTPCALFPRVKTPVIDPAEATEQTGTPINVNISSATAGATILYSTDGENWNEYTGTLDVNSDEPGEVTLYAKATKAGFVTSHIATATYTFTGNPYTATSLADLIASGDTDTKYNITDLTCVQYVTGTDGNGGFLICKDDSHYAGQDVIEQGQYNFMDSVKTTILSDIAANTDYTGWAVPAQYDQSNWVALQLPGGFTVDDLAVLMGHRLTAAKGKLVDALNPVFMLDELPTPGDDHATARNLYTAASFGGTQQPQGDGWVYFFVQPKPMELANIAWTQWNEAENQFIAPVHDGGAHAQWNPAELVGTFAYNDAYQIDKTAVLEDGHLYAMEAIIKLAGVPAASNAKRRAAATRQYVVYPLSLTRTSSVGDDGVITEVTRVGSREVTATVYYNLAGQRSNRPWQGVNIVVTRYSDGTTQTLKQVH